MSSDEAPKIEPTLTSIESAPSITPPAGDVSVETKIEPKVEAKAEQKADAEKVTASSAAEPTLPPAPKLSSSESETRVEPKLNPRTDVMVMRMPKMHGANGAKTSSGPTIDATPAAKPRVGRFALLAACVAIAASFGAIGGSLGVAKFGPLFAAAPPAPEPAPKNNVAEEVKALKETVAQLRGTTKSLSDNLAALKTSVNSSNNAQNTQIGKIAETLDRVEKAQAEQRKTAAAAAAPTHMASTTQATAVASDVTGSIKPQQQPVPMVLGEPPSNLKPPVVSGWTLRRVYDGAALIEGRDGIIEVETGMVAPGLGRIEGIKRQDGRWVVLTARGMVVGR